jgi:predicted  nucleic acid-binding Zn-ribbon protein
MTEVLGQIVRFGREILALKGQVEKNTLEIKEIREDLKQLTTVIEGIKHQMEIHQLKQDNDLKIQRLELENILLKHFRQSSTNDHAPPMLPQGE